MLITYQEKLTTAQRINRLRNQKENSQRAAAILMTLHAIKGAKLNVSSTIESLARGIRRDDGECAADEPSAGDTITSLV